jgi:DNA topoisomerase I
MPREKAVACIVRLMDQSLIRVGNDEYARHNDSFGLTTMRNHHVKVNGSRIKFSFKGKSGQKVETSIDDPLAAKIVRRCQDLPGQEVFAYIDEEGKHRDVGSGHVNEYLYEVTGQGFTAKDFRTWGGTVIAAEALHACGPCAGLIKTTPRNGSRNGKSHGISETELKRRGVEAIKKAAVALGNRVATCRKFYVHPKLADCYADGRLEKAFRAAKSNSNPPELSREERALVQLLMSL